MKNYSIQFILLFSIISSCNTLELAEIPDLSGNDQVLFPNSEQLLITSIDTGAFNFPIFDISQVLEQQSKQIYIAVFDNPVQLNEDKTEIINQGNIVWSWHSGLTNRDKTQISFRDGQVRQDSLELVNYPLNCFYTDHLDKQLYWAAWAWNESGHYITHSSLSQSLELVINDSPSLISVQKVILHEDSNGDGFINSGEEITLRIDLENKGNQPVREINTTFQSPMIDALPQTIDYGDLNPGQVASRLITFQMPPDLIRPASSSIFLQITGADCYLSQDIVQVQVNGLRFCIKSVRLTQIPPVAPSGLCWDEIVNPIGIPIPTLNRSYPDIYFHLNNLVVGNLVWSSRDKTKDDVHPSPPSGGEDECNFGPAIQPVWSLATCQLLNVSHTHEIVFWDDNDISENLKDEPDKLGTLSFRPLNYSPQRLIRTPLDTTIHLKTSDTEAFLKVSWIP